MSGNICSSNVTAGFIDLATFDEIEKYLYGGKYATSYFVRETKKSTWFTQVPVVLTRASGQCGWGQEWSVNISRAGDYLTDTWLAVEIGDVSVAKAEDGISLALLKWTPNLLHNLVAECCVTFNDLVAARFDSFHLDFWSAFTVPAEKAGIYNTMIGNSGPVQLPANMVVGSTLYGGRFYLPLPFFFSRDSGVALPTAALPYNEMRINFSFRDWSDLITRFNIKTFSSSSLGTTECVAATATDFLNGKGPQLRSAQVWANYAIVSNDERKRMACAPRDILIEQVQTSPYSTFKTTNIDTNNVFDIRFAHSIKALFFAVRNESCPTFWSNYTTRSPFIAFPLGTGDEEIPAYATVCDAAKLNSYNATAPVNIPCNVPHGMLDPMGFVSLSYEGTNRLSQMSNDYFSSVQPFYHAPTIPMAENSCGQGVGNGIANASVTSQSYVVTPQLTSSNGPRQQMATSALAKNVGAEAVLTTGNGCASVGYHMYSYSLDFICLDPMGSTNFGKLTNVTLTSTPSDDAVSMGNVASGLYTGDPAVAERLPVYSSAQKYAFVLTAVNNNIVRISGGALGFPVL
jgi:hypothetical protein